MLNLLDQTIGALRRRGSIPMVMSGSSSTQVQLAQARYTHLDNAPDETPLPTVEGRRSFALINRVWWFVPMMALLALIMIAVTSTQAVVPVAVYTLF